VGRDYKNILIFRLGQLGDTLVCLPALQAIRENFPNTCISMLTDGYANSAYVSPSEILPDGLIDEYIRYSPADKNIVSLIKKVLEIRHKQFDALIYLAPRQRTPRQIQRDRLFFKIAGIKHIMIGKYSAPLPDINKSSRPLPAQEHELDYYLSLLDAYGIPVPAKEARRLDIWLTEEEKNFARTFLCDKIGDDWGLKMLVGICPAAKVHSKIWNIEYFSELLRRMIYSYNVFPIIFGAGSEAELGNVLIKEIGRGVNAAGCLSVRQAAAVLNFCRLYVGNDTGGMHMAVSTNTPCVVPFAAQDWPGRWYPYGDGHKVLRKNVDCEGCRLSECPRGNKCLMDISVDEVFAACDELLNNKKY
jgi:ADP-heptose:LPS heptosyltransferase